MWTGWRTKRAAIPGAVILIVVALVLAVPPLINLDGQRPAVAARMSRLLGGPVTMDGPLSMSALPVPHLTARDVSLSGLGSVPRLEIRPRWSALFGGRFEIGSLRGTVGSAEHAMAFDASLGSGFGATPIPIDLRLHKPNDERLVRLQGTIAEANGALSFDGTLTASSAGNAFSGAARFELSLDQGVATLNQANLALPGGASATLFGVLDATGDLPRFDGDVEVSSPASGPLLQAMGVEAPGLSGPANPMQIGGKIAWRPGEIRLDDGRGSLGVSKMAVTLDMTTGTRAALGLAIAMDRLDAASLIGMQVSSTSLGPISLGNLDVNVRARIAQLGLGSLTANNVDLDAAWIHHHLAVKSMKAADLAGAQIELSGGIDGLGVGRGPIKLSDVRYRAHADEFNAALAKLGAAPLAGGAKLGPAIISGTLEGGLGRAIVVTRFEAAGILAKLNGQIAMVPGDIHYDLALEASHADSVALIDLLAPGYRPARALGGSALSAHITGGLHGLAVSDLRVAVGPANMAGRIDVLLASKPHIDVKLSAGEISLDSFLAHAAPKAVPVAAKPGKKSEHPGKRPYGSETFASAPRDKVKVGALAPPPSTASANAPWLNRFDGTIALDAQALNYGHMRFDSPSATLTVATGQVELSQFTAQILGGTLTAKGLLNGQGTFGLDATLAGAQLRGQALQLGPLTLSEGKLDGRLTLNGIAGPGSALAQSLSGTGRIAVSDGLITGFDLKQANDALARPNLTGLLNLLKAGLPGGGTRFSSLAGTFKIDRGVIASNDLRMKAEGGGATVAGHIDLPGNSIDLRTEITLAGTGPNDTSPPLAFVLTGDLDSPRRIFDINALGSWLASRGLGRGLAHLPSLKSTAKAKSKHRRKG